MIVSLPLLQITYLCIFIIYEIEIKSKYNVSLSLIIFFFTKKSLICMY